VMTINTPQQRGRKNDQQDESGKSGEFAHEQRTEQ
jgi:hypothetical protein